MLNLGNFSSSNTPSTQYSSINTPNMMSPWSNNTPSTISGNLIQSFNLLIY